MVTEKKKEDAFWNNIYNYMKKRMLASEFWVPLSEYISREDYSAHFGNRIVLEHARDMAAWAHNLLKVHLNCSLEMC